MRNISLCCTCTLKSTLKVLDLQNPKLDWSHKDLWYYKGLLHMFKRHPLSCLDLQGNNTIRKIFFKLPVEKTFDQPSMWKLNKCTLTYWYYWYTVNVVQHRVRNLFCLTKKFQKLILIFLYEQKPKFREFYYCSCW